MPYVTSVIILFNQLNHSFLRFVMAVNQKPYIHWLYYKYQIIKNPLKGITIVNTSLIISDNCSHAIGQIIIF